MNIDTIGKYKVKIDLTDAEIQHFFGGYEMINYSSQSSKTALGNLLRLALPSYMLPLDCNRILIEVFPTKNGCSIFLTFRYFQEAPKKFRIVSEEKSYTVVFKDSESMIKGIIELAKNRIIQKSKSSLFFCHGSYRLIIKTLNSINGSLLHIREYCTSLSKSNITAAVTEEYGKIICPQNAVTYIGAVFGDTKAP